MTQDEIVVPPARATKVSRVVTLQMAKPTIRAIVGQRYLGTREQAPKQNPDDYSDLTNTLYFTHSQDVVFDFKVTLPASVSILEIRYAARHCGRETDRDTAPDFYSYYADSYAADSYSRDQDSWFDVNGGSAYDDNVLVDAWPIPVGRCDSHTPEDFEGFDRNALIAEYSLLPLDSSGLGDASTEAVYSFSVAKTPAGVGHTSDFYYAIEVVFDKAAPVAFTSPYLTVDATPPTFTTAPNLGPHPNPDSTATTETVAVNSKSISMSWAAHDRLSSVPSYDCQVVDVTDPDDLVVVQSWTGRNSYGSDVRIAQRRRSKPQLSHGALFQIHVTAWNKAGLSTTDTRCVCVWLVVGELLSAAVLAP